MSKLITSLFKLSLIFIISAFFSISFAKSSIPKDTINILTWWGYLAYPEIITTAENECNVHISFDEYFSNDEFLRRWEGQKDYYDVVIFSDTIYNIIKEEIPRFSNSNLWKHSAYYNPIIKKHYDNTKYPHNIVYFMHALTGFLWNPKNINISENDSLTSIFNKAKHKYVVIIDDPVEAKKLIEAGMINEQRSYLNNEILSTENFNRVAQQSIVFITNNYNQIYTKPDFAFSFSWSGEAVIDVMESNEKYEFLIHPKLSYVTSDLIAQTSKRNGSLCVAKFLSSKKTMSSLQKKGFYFSPYTDYSDIQNKVFFKIYSKFVSSLPKLTWIDSINETDFHKINQSWQLIKLSLNNHITGVNKHGNSN